MIVEITPMDPTTFTALLSYVAAASALAVAAVLGIQAAQFAPLLVGKFVALVRRRNV
jgi:hypothetical protein